MAKITTKPSAIKPLLSASEYCASQRLNKLSSLIFVKIMFNKYKNSRFTEDEWELKRKELYSRQAQKEK